MDNLTAPDHAKAMNLARRFTTQNENDLMQEDLYDDTMDEKNLVHLAKPDHAKAVNLARRFTTQNENDLMQESMFDEQEAKGMIEPKKEYSKEICEELAQHVVHAKYLPSECAKHSEAVQYAKSHEKDTTDATQVLS